MTNNKLLDGILSILMFVIIMVGGTSCIALQDKHMIEEKQRLKETK